MLCYLILGSLVGTVRSVKADIEEIRIPRGVILYTLCRLGSDKISGITLVIAGISVVVPVQLTLTQMREIIQSAVQAAIEVGEAAVQRIIAEAAVAEMPLSYHRAVRVTVLSEDVGHGPLILVETVVPPRRYNGLADAETARITSGHYSAAGRGTDGSHIEAVQFDTFACYAVYVRGLDAAAVITQVTPAEVIGYDYDNVRFFYLLGGTACADGSRSCCGKPCVLDKLFH